MAFVSYWDIERGKKLPKTHRLENIIGALGLNLYSPEGKELIRAYFLALSGSEELLQVISTPEKDSQMDLSEIAAQKLMSRLSINLNMEQLKIIVQNKVNCFCNIILSETNAWLTVKELSKGLGFNAKEIKKSLKALAGCKLAEISGDKARGAYVGKIITMMPISPVTLPLRKALRTYYNAFLAQKKPLMGRRCFVRMSQSAMKSYSNHLRKVIDLGEVYGNSNESKENSAIYFIDARLVELFPKKDS